MSGDLGYAFLILPICVTLPVWYWLRRRSRNTLPYPPGPKGYPLIGNVLDFPTGVPSWEGFMTMAKQHGEINHFTNTPRCTSDVFQCQVPMSSTSTFLGWT